MHFVSGISFIAEASHTIGFFFWHEVTYKGTGVNLDLVSTFPSDQVVYRCVKSFAFEVP